jgi:tetratricopeptide (TPR) repeat protein
MTTTPRRLVAAGFIFALALRPGRTASAAEQWLEVKSPHFTITSDAGKGSTTELAWQLEQVRSEVAALWPWAKVDLNKPLVVFALKDEQAMKTLAPKYWEKKNAGVSSVWVGGYDRTCLALRTDVQMDGQRHVNPFATSYFAYFSLILQQSVPKRLPPWFARGLAGVMSNTVVQDAKILLGPPAPWYLETLHQGGRASLSDVVAAANGSPLLQGDRLRMFDAQAWALVHYLMFGDDGAHWQALGRYSALVAGGADAGAAFREALGRPEDLETPVRVYMDRSIYSYRVIGVDATVKREGFTVTPIAPAEAAARRAMFHVAMNRPIEARAAIDEARKAGGAPGAEVAEAVLLDSDDKTDAARAAYARATDAGATDPYAYYRLASLLWSRDADRATLERLEKLLSKATALNNRYARAYSFLADTQGQLGIGDPPAFALRAVSLEPAEAHYRLVAARLLADAKNYDAALKQVQAAAELADSEAVTRQVAELREWIERRKQ